MPRDPTRPKVCEQPLTVQRVLIGSPVNQKPPILAEFLKSLSELDVSGTLTDFAFVDDNQNPDSSAMLAAFHREGSRVFILESATGAVGTGRQDYVCDDKTHRWNEDLVWRVAEHKDRMIRFALENEYDYLFLIDSDLVLHPDTLRHLITCGRAIVSEIFWTQWQPDSPPLPQVWLQDQYTLFEHARGERISQEEAQSRTRAFLESLKTPGLYEVGGLGACTLISREALQKGVSFREVPNVSFWGEDRHFCIRAAALGLRLYVDTCYPAYHIYRESDLERVKDYREANRTEAQAPVHKAAATLLKSHGIRSEMNKILSAAKRAVERFWSFDFRDPRRDDGMELLAPDYWSEISKGLEDDLRASMQARLISRTDVLSSRLALIDSEATEALVTGRVLTHGVEQDRYFRELYDCRVLVTRPEKETRWLVRGVEFTRVPEPDLPDFMQTRVTKYEGNRLTLSMLVRNEAGRYLRRVLEHAAQYIDAAVILDDASEDDTVEVCRQALSNIPTTIVSNSKHGFHNEVELRRQQWELTVSTNPDWILVLDADEMLEDRATSAIRDLINQPFYDYYSFRLYDFWDPTHYREDPYWQAHKTYRVFLVRYQPRFKYTWQETPLHCGRLPNNVTALPGARSELRVKHFGWATPADRELKYRRYKMLDPNARYGIKQQYESILDPHPSLVEWID